MLMQSYAQSELLYAPIVSCIFLFVSDDTILESNIHVKRDILEKFLIHVHKQVNTMCISPKDNLNQATFL